jgi:hypothetical protein
MSDIPEQTRECSFVKEFIKTDEKTGLGYWTECPNMKETGGDMDCERYSCAVCKKSYTLYYDEMR